MRDSAAHNDDVEGDGGRQRELVAVMRTPKTAVFVPLLVMLTVTPMALAATALALLYLVPIAAIVWLMRRKTVAGSAGLTRRTVLRTQFYPWSQLQGLSISKFRVHAVLIDGTTVGLPSVRARHLPAVSVASRGRIPDPTADPA